MTTKKFAVVFDSDGNARRATEKEYESTKKAAYKRIRELMSNVRE